MSVPTPQNQAVKTVANLAADTVETMAEKYPPLTGFSTGTASAVNGESSGAGAGVFGRGKVSDGVHGESAGANMSGVAGIHTAGGNGVYGKSNGNAGTFDGRVSIRGDVEITGTLSVDKDIVFVGGDCAEQFDTVDNASIEPGTLLVVDVGGALKASEGAYDKRVVGVVAGAGHYRPALILDKGPSDKTRVVVSLMGKAFCKVDASYGAIAVGDLLTSSPERGHAMVAESRERSFGTVVGKALGEMPTGKGMIPILLALQ